MKAHQAVLNRANAHEVATMCDFNAWGFSFDNECGDLGALTSIDDLRRGLRHHDEQIGNRPIGTPQFLAVDQIMFAIWR